MLKPNFLLTNKIEITVYRRAQGSYVNGDWVEGTTTPIARNVNIQPYKPYELMLLPEAERSRAWFKLYSDEDFRTQKEGVGGYDADEFDWQGNRYKVMKVENYSMGILDHWKVHAVRVELTPN